MEAVKDGDARAQRIRALQRMAIFGGIIDEVIADLVERANMIEVKAGEYFFRGGERGNSAFVLEVGEVSVRRMHEGQEHLLRYLCAGDCFGEVALLDFGPRSASVRAEQDCSAIELTASSLAKVAKGQPAQFAMIYMNLGRELSRRLREADERLFKARSRSQPEAEGWLFGSS